MWINKQKVTAFQEQWMCDKEDCGGEMIATGKMFMTTMYHHQCSKCGTEQGANEQYPRIVHEVEKSDPELGMITRKE